MIELPRQDPCEICETLAGRSTVPVIAESELTITVVNPVQFEVGQCCVVTRRHVGTLLDLTDDEGAAVIKAAREVAQANAHQPQRRKVGCRPERDHDGELDGARADGELEPR